MKSTMTTTNANETVPFIQQYHQKLHVLIFIVFSCDSLADEDIHPLPFYIPAMRTAHCMQLKEENYSIYNFLISGLL